MLGKNEISCPNCGVKHEKDDLTHAAESYADEFFPEIWKEGKSKLKNMSKKEVAEQMYFLGVMHFMEEIHHSVSKMKKELKSEMTE